MAPWFAIRPSSLLAQRCQPLALTIRGGSTARLLQFPGAQRSMRGLQGWSEVLALLSAGVIDYISLMAVPWGTTIHARLAGVE
ncbi:hypothetical protein ASD52_02625 [Ensifer sp. Root142]|nr:hypothetical protein ASD52_02625 [Ensifer sp. Root142]